MSNAERVIPGRVLATKLCGAGEGSGGGEKEKARRGGAGDAGKRGEKLKAKRREKLTAMGQWRRVAKKSKSKPR